MSRSGWISSLALSLLMTAVPAAGDPVPDAPDPIHVHCGGVFGGSLQQVVEGNRTLVPLVIEFAGICTGDVRIERDDVHIHGIGDDPTVVGRITVTRAMRVELRDFIVRDSDLYGIVVEHGSVVRLERVRVEDSWASGLMLLGSTAQALDCTFSSNGLGGVDLRSNSTLLLEGRNDCNHNIVGAVLTGASHIEMIGDAAGVLNVDSNSLGMLAANSSVELGRVEASYNFYGVALDGQTTASISRLNAESNVVAVDIRDASHLWLLESEVEQNDLGISADSGNLLLTDSSVLSNGLDVALEFGAQATFDDSVLGTLFCDGTVLSRGHSCDAAAHLAADPARPDPRELLPDWFWTGAASRPAAEAGPAPAPRPATRPGTRVALW